MFLQICFSFPVLEVKRAWKSSAIKIVTIFEVKQGSFEVVSLQPRQMGKSQKEGAASDKVTVAVSIRNPFIKT